MTVFINPGSHIGETGEGWTNTFKGAKAEAERWLKQMHEDGLLDVVLATWDETEMDGRWKFEFEHTVTKKRVTLETHGISDIETYCKRRIFSPKVYWDGSSCGAPEIEHFAAPGFQVLKSFKAT
ncbi:hypothetical protein DMH01_03465 [Amycolatopsis sp. WAC 04182]|uniref:hypothetical protein n=1 Tax=Amycolatopsis sp. WAC 04182 TaxID=2203198 RepID=UPI000F790B5D|nr:hypothetical protein [Amycolatopsis sp. WAC 04182]RSN65448.1 hypothetical protein DMH01_03465 [Amycolatopsis sp. WAC 04182]